MYKLVLKKREILLLKVVEASKYVLILHRKQDETPLFFLLFLQVSKSQ